MIIEVKRLISKKVYEGKFSFEYTPSQDKILIPLCRFDGDVKVTGGYEIFEDGSVEVTFNVAYRIVGQCSYCLEDAASDISYDFAATFTTDKDNYDDYYYDGYKVDLTTAVNDALLASQPDTLLCKKCVGK